MQEKERGKIMTLMSFLYRRGCGKSDKKRDEGLTTPSDIKRFDNISYGTKKEQLLDVYRPKGEDVALAVIVSVHGGGWIYGDKDVYQWYCMSLAQRGFAVVNFTYRLAPEHKYPAAIEDTNLVFEWIRENAQLYGFDTENVFAVGDSAGGHMLSVYAAMKTNPEYAAQYDFPVEKNIKLNAVALNCGKYDMIGVLQTENKQQQKMMKMILPQKGTEKEMHWITSLEHMTGDFPPTYIMTSNDDFLKEEAPKLEAKLKELGVEYKYKEYGDENEKLGHVFHCNIKTESARKCNDDECEFFRSHTCQAD